MKILIIGPAWVGDMVMAQSLFMTLRRQNRQALIDVVAPAWTRPLLQRMPEVRAAIDMPVGHGQLQLGTRRALGLSLRMEHYDQAIVLPNSFKSALLPWFARIPKRTGWRGEARSLILNDCRKLDKQQYPLMIQRFNALAWPAGREPDEELPYPRLRVEQSGISELQAKFSLGGTRPVLALCPGAEFGPSKQWPARHYAAVADTLIGRGYDIWIFGSDNDESIAQEIEAGLDDSHKHACRNLSGKTSLAEAIDLLSCVSAVLSNDSGLMHVAAALDKPLVVLYGSTSPGFTPPLSRQVQILSLGLECSPCFKRECPLQHHRCMLELKPESVLGALTQLGLTSPVKRSDRLEEIRK